MDAELDQKNTEELIDPAFASKAIPSTTQAGVAPAVVSVPISIAKFGRKKDFVIRKYLQLIWDFDHEFNDSGRDINVEKIITNCRSLITGELRGRDPFWKEHASANLRELTFGLTRDSYNNALSSVDITNQEIIGYFDTVEQIVVRCLHQGAHFRIGGCIENAKDILTITDNSITDDEVFDRLAAFYLFNVYKILAKCGKVL